MRSPKVLVLILGAERRRVFREVRGMAAWSGVDYRKPEKQEKNRACEEPETVQQVFILHEPGRKPMENTENRFCMIFVTET